MVSATTGHGIPTLVHTIRDTLAPPQDLAAHRPGRFPNPTCRPGSTKGHAAVVGYTLSPPRVAQGIEHRSSEPREGGRTLRVVDGRAPLITFSRIRGLQAPILVAVIPT